MGTRNGMRGVFNWPADWCNWPTTFSYRTGSAHARWHGDAWVAAPSWRSPCLPPGSARRWPSARRRGKRRQAGRAPPGPAAPHLHTAPQSIQWPTRETVELNDKQVEGHQWLTHNSPKYLEWNLASNRNSRDFSLEIRNFKLWKIAKLLDFRFPEGWYFLKRDNTELKRSYKILFSVSERHRWAVMG